MGPVQLVGDPLVNHVGCLSVVGSVPHSEESTQKTVQAFSELLFVGRGMASHQGAR